MPIAIGALAGSVLAGCAGAQNPSEPTPTAAHATPAVTAAPTATPGSSAPANRIGTFTMDDSGCVYAGADDADSGTVILGLENRSTARFDADLWRLSNGHTHDELAAHVAEEDARLIDGRPPLGHPSFATLVAEATVIAGRGDIKATLAPGTYGLACVRFVDEVPVRIWAAGPFSIR